MQEVLAVNAHLRRRAVRFVAMIRGTIPGALAIACVGAMLPICASVAQAGAPFRMLEPPGPNRVGVRVVEQYDFSRSYRDAVDALGRPYRGERARPIQTLIWYPASPSLSAPMTVADYVELLATERSFGHPRMPVSGQQMRAGMRATLSTRLMAVRDAPALPGRFPVVIYAPGFLRPAWENADLFEYLASHGYVVISSPSIAKANHLSADARPAFEPQVRDIGFLFASAQSLPNADMSQIAVMGFSWGGGSNIVAAATDARIKALVSLDGSLLFEPKDVRKAGAVPEQMTIPLLSIAQGQRKFDTDILDAWTHGDTVAVYLLGFTHGEHSSMAQRDEQFWRDISGMFSELKARYGREAGMTGYAWLARYTREFLDAYLKHDAAALKFVRSTPRENGVPEDLLRASYRAAARTAATYENFRVALANAGFDRAAALYAQFQQHSPDFKLEQKALSDWADDLLEGGQFPPAIVVLRLATQLYPDSGEAFMSLAEGYRLASEPTLAIENYERARRLGPLHVSTHAANAIGELRSGRKP